MYFIAMCERCKQPSSDSFTSSEYKDKVEIVKLNIDDPKTAEMRVKYKFRVQPYFVLLGADGEVVKTWSGYTERATFDDAFAGVLNW